MAHDYRIMNSERGYWCMPPVDLGLHFDGIGSLLRAKLGPTAARKVLLQGHKYKATEALGDGIVDDIASPDEMLDKALALARKIQSKARMGVYGMLRAELYGEAIQAFANISNVYARVISREAKVKL
jgi:enoyl-CoA hydratase/carnithine racemase